MGINITFLIATRGHCKNKMLVDRSGHDKTLVVVDMLPYEVDSTGCKEEGCLLVKAT